MGGSKEICGQVEREGDTERERERKREREREREKLNFYRDYSHHDTTECFCVGV